MHIPLLNHLKEDPQMPFCSNCGQQHDNGLKFCPNCGAAVETAAPQQEYTAPQQEYAAPQQEYAAPQQEYAAQDETVYTGNKTYAILAIVFPILFFLPLITGDKTEFDKFWANQALILFIANAVASITAAIIIGAIIGIFTFVCWIIALVAVCQGKKKEMPLIGKICLIK